MSQTAVTHLARSWHRHVTGCVVAWLEWLVDVFVPSSCACCREPGALLCEECLRGLSPVTGSLCERCGSPTAWPVERCRECASRRIAFASARAAVLYAGPARVFMRRWKEGGLRPLSVAAAAIVADHVPAPHAEVITYIPSDGDRNLRRGHQPAQGLARELGNQWGLEVEPLVVRARRVGRQTGLSLADRRRNMRGAFKAARKVRGRVILVDDVYTTGATVGAAASALRAGGASAVHVVTFARAVR